MATYQAARLAELILRDSACGDVAIITEYSLDLPFAELLRYFLRNPEERGRFLSGEPISLSHSITLEKITVTNWIAFQVNIKGKIFDELSKGERPTLIQRRNAQKALSSSSLDIEGIKGWVRDALYIGYAKLNWGIDYMSGLLKEAGREAVSWYGVASQAVMEWSVYVRGMIESYPGIGATGC